jgi:hypothetical protein
MTLNADEAAWDVLMSLAAVGRDSRTANLKEVGGMDLWEFDCLVQRVSHEGGLGLDLAWTAEMAYCPAIDNHCKNQGVQWALQALAELNSAYRSEDGGVQGGVELSSS